MPIKPIHSSSRLAAALFTAFTISSVCAAPSAPSPYKLSIEPTQIEPEQIPQPSNLNANTAVQDAPQAYQLEYKYRASTAAPKKIKAALPLTPPASKPTKALTLAANQAVFGKFSPQVLNNEKLANQPFAKEIGLAASAASLDPALVHAVVYVESHYRHSAISSKGAIGLMQVLPETAARYGIADPGKSRTANLKAGTLYLRDLMRMFDNRIDLVLAAYNAGEGAVMKHSMRVPPYRETRLYVVAVMAKYNEWRNDRLNYGKPVDEIDADADLMPVHTPTAKLEYLAGTRLASSDPVFAPNY